MAYLWTALGISCPILPIKNSSTSKCRSTHNSKSVNNDSRRQETTSRRTRGGEGEEWGNKHEEEREWQTESSAAHSASGWTVRDIWTDLKWTEVKGMWGEACRKGWLMFTWDTWGWCQHAVQYFQVLVHVFPVSCHTHTHTHTPPLPPRCTGINMYKMEESCIAVSCSFSIPD